MRKFLLLVVFVFTIFSVFSQKKRNDLMDVTLISNSGDTTIVQTKESYFNEHSFNSFGYYFEDGSRGRAHPDQYKKIIMGTKYLESIKLRSSNGKCTKQIFAERIIDGPMKVYQFRYFKEMVYTSKCIIEVFLKKSNEECAVPVYKETCPHTYHMVGQPKNRDDILELFSDAPQIINKIESGYYQRHDYATMVREYNRLQSK